VKTLNSVLLIATFFVCNAAADIIGTASSFGVLAGSTVTNTGTTVVNGSVGVSPGSAITGFPPGLVVPPGVIDAGNAVAAQAESDLNTGYNSLAGLTVNSNLTGMDLGGLVLTPGVYQFDSSAQLTGTLTLNAEGLANAYWVFQIGSTLTTASASAVNIINGGPNEGLFWQVGSSATLGTTTAFEGNIVALTSITLDTGATISCGRALAINGAVTLDTNTIDTGCAATAETDDGLAGFVANGSGGLSPSPSSTVSPEPTFLIVPPGLVIVGMALRRKRARAAVSNG
jgi:type VI secretion system secreted protein VgrG